MKLMNLDHMVLTTGNLEKCLGFYEGLLGMRHEINGTKHVLKFGSQQINIHTRPGEFQLAATNPTAGTLDFCLIADGDIYEMKKELEEAGAEIIAGVVERNGVHGKMDSIYMYDPDGNLVEVAVYR